GYTSNRVEVISGSEYFRPVAMAPVPANVPSSSKSAYTFYVTDWVFSSYELHGRGRLWKLEIDKAPWVKAEPEPRNAEALQAQQLRSGQSQADLPALFELARGKDPYLADAALTAIAKVSSAWTPESLLKLSAQDRLWALVALRRVDLSEEKWVRAIWRDQDPAIRFEALRWIADGVLTSFKDDVQQLLKASDIDYELFEAALATWNTLNGNPGAGVTDPEVLSERVNDPAAPANIKSFALRLVPANHKKIDVPLLKQLFAVGDRSLSIEVVRTLGAKKSPDALVMLSEIANNQSLDAELRADALAGLAQATQSEHVSLLLAMASQSNRTLRHEALRGLRGTTIDASAREKLQSLAQQFPESAELVTAVLEPASLQTGRPLPTDTAAWLKRLEALPGAADPAAGRRLFHQAGIGQCANCHRHSGRGNVVGPDLSLVARQGDRANILRSLLEPNRDVAPQYFATALELTDGSIFTGILLRSSSVDVYRDATGKERVFQKSDVVQRKELKTSMMPTGLVSQLCDHDLRDLLAFLTGSN
ncbi:MAG: c-type cytochrome, partial [Pirellulaceae bacterium]|nr:c-type cytochrome [Pirellulaceae bacterium]